MSALKFIMVKDRKVWGKGPCGGEQFSTVWLIEGKPAIVSSVSNPHTTETMIFPIINGEVDYMELWCEKEYLSNPSQHAKLISEYLRYQEGLS